MELSRPKAKSISVLLGDREMIRSGFFVNVTLIPASSVTVMGNSAQTELKIIKGDINIFINKCKINLLMDLLFSRRLEIP
jgi:hypothetical protein